MDPGHHLVGAQHIQPLPFRFVATLLHQLWTPREFFTTVYSDIVTNGLQLQCAPLVNWMYSICTARNAREAISRVGHQPLNVPLANAVLREHRHQLVLTKLPALLLAPTTVGASQIANSLGKLVQQLAGVCQDATTHANALANKTPQDHYGPTLEVWIQLSHVMSEAHMPPVHSALATNRKKQTQSKWEEHVSQAALTKCYLGIQVVIPPAVSKKLSRCNWLSYNTDDLSTGINCCQLGGSTQENLSLFEEIARTHNLALLTGSGDFAQIHQVLNNKTVDILRTDHQAHLQLKGFRMLVIVAFGVNHTSTSALQTFIESMRANMEVLHHYMPRAPNHKLLGPALVCQQYCLHFNVWVLRQLGSPTPMPFPPGVHEIWDQILLGDPSWEKLIPYAYLRLYRPKTAPTTVGAPVPGPSPAPAKGLVTGDPRQLVHQNEFPNKDFEPFLQLKGNQSLKQVINQCR
jgi:hypothetical protein